MNQVAARGIPPKASLVILPLLGVGLPAMAASAQGIIAEDGSQTITTTVGDRIDITGGQASANHSNLFQSFEQFDLEAQQTANFVTTPNIQNVVGRVHGDTASMINGTLQVSGSDANLYLMNPAGILIGPDTQLNLPASFTATTANGIEFDQDNVTAFQFPSEHPGAVVNVGDLTVQPGESISLVGGTVVNTGNISAPGGTLTLAAVEGNSMVRLQQGQQLLSLEIDRNHPFLEHTIRQPTSIGEMLTGGNLSSATELITAPDGSVRLRGQKDNISETESSAILPGRGMAIASGSLSTVGDVGGNINVLGDRVTLNNANLDASGNYQGGLIRIGGDYKGNGPVYNASQTNIDLTSTLDADALDHGDGGRVIVWSDEVTSFSGQINARSGLASGNGGFAEVSGKKQLAFNGNADLRAPQGEIGTLLLDPENWTITKSPFPPADTATNSYVSAAGLTFQSGFSNISLEATNDVTVEDVNVLLLVSGTSVNFTADSDGNGMGEFIMLGTDSVLEVGRGEVTISGAGITVTNIYTGTDIENVDGNSGIEGGNVTLTSSQGVSVNSINTSGILDPSKILDSTLDNYSGHGGDVTIRANNGDITVNDSILTSSINPLDFAGDGGIIDLEASGNIQTGILQTTSVTGANNAGRAGDIIINSLSGNVLVSDIINTQSVAINNAGGGGLVSIQANNGSITTNSISTVSGAELGPAGLGGVASGQAGTILLTALDDITTEALKAFSQAETDASDAGDITLTTSNGTISTQNITTYSNAMTGVSGDAGDISLIAFGDITSSDVRTFSQAPNNAGLGGDITLTTSNGNISTQNIVASSNAITGTSGDAGDIYLTAFGDITSSNVRAFSQAQNNAGLGGDIFIESLNGGIGAAGIDSESTAIGDTSGDGGNVELIANSTIDISNDVTTSSLAGGDTSGQGGTIQVSGNEFIVDDLRSSSSASNNAGDAGFIGVSAQNLIRINDGIYADSIGGGNRAAIELTADGIDLKGGAADSIVGNTILLEPASLDQNINIGTTSGSTGLDLLDDDLDEIDISVSQIFIGRPDSTGTITLYPGALTSTGNARPPIQILGGESLIAPDVATNILLTGAGAGLVQNEDLSFTNIENLVGGNNDDVFLPAPDVSLEDFNSIDGGGGFNQISYSEWLGTPIEFDLGVIVLNNIQNIIGSGNGSTLVGNDSGQNWIIDGTDSGSVDGQAFEAFNNLTGGLGEDSFSFLNSGTLTGNIDGADGQDSLDYTAFNAPINIDLANNSATALTAFNNIENFIGSSNNSDVLLGTNNNDIFELTSNSSGNVNSIFSSLFTFNDIEVLDGQGGINTFSTQTLTPATNSNWIIDANNSGSVNGIDFNNFENLIGNALDDTFNFITNGDISGNIIGGAGDDTLDFSAFNSPVSLDIATLNGIEMLVGSANDDTLVGTTNNDVFTIDGANSGDVGGIAFSSFESLDGQAGDDNFNVIGTGSLTGDIIGGAGTNDTLNYAGLTNAVTVDIATLNGIETLIGSVNDDTLVGTANNDVFTIDGANSGDVGGIDFSSFESLDGQAGDDNFNVIGMGSLTGDIIGGAGTNDTLNYAGLLGPVTVDIATLNGIETLVGSANDDTLVGTANNDVFTIDGANSGDVGGIAFSSFESLDGQAEDDNFSFINMGSITGDIIGGVGTNDTVNYAGVTNAVTVDITTLNGIETLVGSADNDTLVGTANNDVFTINGTNSGDVDGLIFSSFESLDGQAGDDNFNVIGNGDITNDIIGGAGTNDTLNYAGLIGSVTVDIATLSGIETLVGSDNDDTLVGTTNNDIFTINGTNSGDVGGILFSSFESLDGQVGDDNFNFIGNGDITNDIIGGAGTNDTLNYAGVTNAVTVDIATLTGIETLVGSANDDTLVGTSNNDVFTIDGTNAGDVGGIDFSSFESLDGQAGDDNFNVIDTGSITNDIVGGTGTNDTLNYAGLTNAVTVDIATLNGIETLVGSANDDTLVGTSNNDVFTIDSANSGDVGGITFSSFESLDGLAGDDNFNVIGTGSITGDIIGGAGTNDTLDFSGLTGSATVDIATLNGIETLIGSANDDTLVGTSNNDVFTIDGVNSGDVGGITFSSFESLDGLAGDDNFNFIGNGAITNDIVGGVGTNDTLNYAGLTNAVTVDIATLTGIETLVGSANDDTLVGTSNNDVFTIDGTNAGDVGGIDFSSFESLDGQAGDDNFNVINTGSITGDIIGGAGTTDTLNYAGFLGSVTVDIATLTGIETLVGSANDDTLVGTTNNDIFTINGTNSGDVGGIDFSSFESLDGQAGDDNFNVIGNGDITNDIIGGAGTNDTLNYAGLIGSVTVDIATLSGIEMLVGSANDDTLVGTSNNDTFTIDGTNSGDVGGILFSSFESLDGQSGDDNFNFIGNGDITNDIVGGAGTNDTLNYAGLIGSVTVDIATLNGIETLVGSANNDTLVGTTNNDDTFTINGVNSGDVGGILFSSFESLDGQAGDNNFSFINMGSITGDIIGGVGTNDTLDFSGLTGSATVDIATLNGIETLIGSANDDTLVGTSNNDVFTIDGSNAGAVGAIDFSSFESLDGQAGDDNFNFIGTGSITGDIIGGVGTNDTFDYSGLTSSVTVNVATLNGIEVLTGSANDDTLVGTTNNDVFTINGTNSGDVGGITFSSFELLDGLAGDDNFNFIGNGAITNDIVGGAGTNDTLNYAGLTNAVTVDIATLTGIETLVGSANDDTLVGTSNNDVFTINGTNSGDVDGLIFSSFESLDGQAGDDNFNVIGTGSITGDIIGGVGTNDTVNYAGVTNAVTVDITTLNGIETLVGSADNDTLVGTGNNDVFTINGLNSGDVGGIDFSSFESLDGQAGDDNFNVISTGSITGDIIGGAGTNDTVNYAGVMNAVTVDIATLTGIEMLVGSADNDTLVGTANNDVFTINGTNSGDVDGLIFSSFESLDGQAGDDNFNVIGTGSITGDIIGGVGTNDTVNYAGVTNAVTVDITTLNGIETLVGSADNDTLVGTANNDVFTINGTNSGDVDGLIFSSFESLDGQAGDDNFNFIGTGSITGDIIGGVGTNDTLDFSGLTGSATVDIATLNGIETLIGSANDDTLVGTSNNDVFTIDGSNAGAVGAIDFSSFESLDGQAGDDNFNFIGTGSITGDIIGGVGTNDTFDYSGLTSSVTVNVATLNGIEVLTGSANDDTLVGTTNNDVFTINGTNSGDVDGLIFSSFESLDGQAGDDNFNVIGTGSITGDIIGGVGTNDTLDFSTFNSPISVDLYNNSVSGLVSSFDNIENIIGSDHPTDDYIRGSQGNDTFEVTGDRSGIINTPSTTLSFSNIETLDGGDGENTFRLNSSIANTNLTIAGGSNFNQSNNRIVTNYTDTTWQLDNINQGEIQQNGATIASFRDIQHLENASTMAGEQRVEFIVANSQITGSLDSGISDLTLVGNDINIGHAVNANDIRNGRISGSGTLTIKPIDNNLDIELGGLDNQKQNTVNITDGELEAIQDDFINILIGGAEQTGDITLGGDTAVSSPLTLQSQGNIDTTGGELRGDKTDANINITTTDGSINAGNITTLGSDISLTAQHNISVESLSSTGDINGQGILLNSSNGGINVTNDIESRGSEVGNDIDIKAQVAVNIGGDVVTSGGDRSGDLTITTTNGALTTGNITTANGNLSGSIRGAGSVTLESAGDIQVGFIDARGNGVNTEETTINIITPTTFRAQAALADTGASLSSTGTQNGSITIEYGDPTVEASTFTIQNSINNGTTGSISTPLTELASGEFIGGYTQANISLINRGIPPVDPPEQSALIPGAFLTQVGTLSTTGFGEGSLMLSYNNSVEAEQRELEDIFNVLETSNTGNFESYLSPDGNPVKAPIRTLAEVREKLQEIEQSTTAQPAIVYVYFVPVSPSVDSFESGPDDLASSDNDSTNSAFRPRSNQPDDQLEVMLITADSEPQRFRRWGITREQVEQTAEELRGQVTRQFSTTGQYLPPSQQLYDWILSPVRDHLEAENINSLGFVMNEGLRTLPIAALHDGDQYLIENYSLGLLPTISLTNFDNTHIARDTFASARVLAMGASEFTDQAALPAVESEVNVITDRFLEGDAFLNEAFVRDNLRSQLQKKEYDILHLATHASFEANNIENSFIQLWDEKLSLNNIQDIGLDQHTLDLIILSACNTALGDVASEYGFAGFAVNSGATTAVASVWPVSDEGTLGFMNEFYRELRHTSLRSEAIRQAQLALMQGTVAISDGTIYGHDSEIIAHIPELSESGQWDFSHPFYWSTFTAIGNPW